MHMLQGMTAADASMQLPLRERKKQATREALRRAATDLVRDRGLHGVTVEDIAAAADVAPRTFFNYFPTKEDAIVGWDPAALVAMADLLRARPGTESAPVALRIAILEAIAPSDADPTDVLERLRVIRSDRDLVAHYALRWGETERVLASVIAERRGTDPDSDPYGSLVAATTLAACRTALLAWCASGGARPIGDVLASHLDVVAAGLCEPEGGLR
jgi:AcrR family transcriptional regulator